RPRAARLSRGRPVVRTHGEAAPPGTARPPDRGRRCPGAQRDGARDGGALGSAADRGRRQRRRLGTDPEPAAGVLRRGARGGDVADWVPALRARVRWVERFAPAVLAEGDVVVATAWQSAAGVAAAPARCGAKFYFVQHYESLYHGAPNAVDATYRLPLRKIVISTWLSDLMRERFGSPTDVLVTPVDPDLFHPTPGTVSTSRPRVLMLHHEYAW